jgi:hypothetical protein
MFHYAFCFSLELFFASILEPLFLWSKGIVVRGFLWTHHNSRIRNDHASRGELSERNVVRFGFDYMGYCLPL